METFYFIAVILAVVMMLHMVVIGGKGEDIATKAVLIFMGAITIGILISATLTYL